MDGGWKRDEVLQGGSSGKREVFLVFLHQNSRGQPIQIRQGIGGLGTKGGDGAGALKVPCFSIDAFKCRRFMPAEPDKPVPRFRLLQQPQAGSLCLTATSVFLSLPSSCLLSITPCD